MQVAFAIFRGCAPEVIDSVARKLCQDGKVARYFEKVFRKESEIPSRHWQ